MIWAMAGMLGALVVGGFVVERLTAPVGTTGSLHEVLPAARARAEAWAPGATWVGFEGRDLVDGRNGTSGAWEFLFADPAKAGRYARVVLGSHVLALRELDPGAVAAAGSVMLPEDLAQTPVLARRLVAYGMRAHRPATFSAEASGSEPILVKVVTVGRVGGTWWLDGRSGDLLEYRDPAGK